MDLLSRLVAPNASAYTDAETAATTVSVYSTAKPKRPAAAKAALRRGLAEIKACGLNIGTARITIQRLPPQDWAESWKRHFKPIRIGTRLLVRPSWLRQRPKRGQEVIVLDPGLSFGTGQHPTTGFCLREMLWAWELWNSAGKNQKAFPSSLRQQSRKPPLSFLDIGTGSGILALAAAKLGYAPVCAFDFDPQCVKIARANARANRVSNRVRFSRADLTELPRRSAARFDVICANLLADLLLAERDRILARLKPGGILVVAGILKREFNAIHRAYESAGLRLVASKIENEWRSGAFVNDRFRYDRGMQCH